MQTVMSFVVILVIVAISVAVGLTRRRVSLAELRGPRVNNLTTWILVAIIVVVMIGVPFWVLWLVINNSS